MNPTLTQDDIDEAIDLIIGFPFEPDDKLTKLMLWDLQHKLHADYGFAFCDITKMLNTFQTSGSEKLKLLVMNHANDNTE